MLWLMFIIIAFAAAVDQITKHAVLSAIGIGGQPVAVIDGFFYIVCHKNSGAAWGILKDGRMLFLIITPVLLAAMLIFMIYNKNLLLRTSLAFIMGGAIGNYIDRLSAGSVVDFLDFYIFGYNFPTFNAADSSIVLGAALMIIYSMRSAKTAENAGTAKTAGAASSDISVTDPAAAETDAEASTEHGTENGTPD